MTSWTLVTGGLPGSPALAGRRTTSPRVIVAVCLALAGVSLLLPSSPTYDPWAWLIWGRELAHGDLVTSSGPSWKPLPVIVTALSSLLGDELAPLAWLLVARTGGLLAVVMAYRVATRTAGRPAGVVAATALVLSDQFGFDVARGNSEGLLVALCLGAVDRHLDGRRAEAMVLGVGAALLRPEVWPFLGIYALVVARSTRVRRSGLLLGAGAVGILAAWFVPELIGSGDPFRAATRAREPTITAATFAARPFVAVLERAAPMLTVPVYVGALVAVVAALRRRDRVVLGLAAVAAGLVTIVGVMTEAGFAGNLRYVALPAAIVCVLSGVGWIELVSAASRWGGRAAGSAVVVAAAVVAVGPVLDDVRDLRHDAVAIADQAALDASLPAAIRAAGGRAAIERCGPVYTGAYQTQVVAWHLRVHQQDVRVDTQPAPPGTVIALKLTAMSRDPDFDLTGRSEHWAVRSSCG